MNHEVDEIVIDYMAENHVPGLAYAVVKNNSIQWSGAYGLADVEKNIPKGLAFLS